MTAARWLVLMCLLLQTAAASTMGVLALDPGSDFEIVLVSFDPRETPQHAAAKKADVMERYKRPGREHGWHFLTGEDVSIRRVTAAAGFRYAWDEDTRQ